MEDLFAVAGLAPEALAGQTALVTGAGRGIGREIARALAALGARVVVAELNEAAGQETADLITAAGGRALALAVDVADAEAVAILIEQARAAFGPVEILINNAILCPAVAVAEMETALWDRVMAVNLRGAFLTCRACLPEMLARRRGTILNLVSTDAMPGLAAYIASKQGLLGFTQSLAVEVGGQGVRVIAFGPGVVDTPGLRGVAPALAPRLGLSEAQFLSLPLHRAYPGLMPAEHAGLAAAYLIARLADEYHGEMVTGYTILERAGVIAAGEGAESGPAPDAGQAAGAAHPADELLRQAAALGAQLQGALAETEAEFNQLPAFIRPLARGGFRNKAGLSLGDWQRAAARLAGLAQAQDWVGLRAERNRLGPRLGQLNTYFAEVPRETARFTHDADLLRQVEATAQARVRLVTTLRQVLDSI